MKKVGTLYDYRKNELLGDGEKPGCGEAHLGPCQLGHKQLQLGTTRMGNIWSNGIMLYCGVVFSLNFVL